MYMEELEEWDKVYRLMFGLGYMRDVRWERDGRSEQREDGQ